MIEKVALILLAIAAMVTPQVSSKTGLLQRLDQLESAISAGDWKTAAAVSDSLKDAVREARNESMARSAAEFTESILNSLPADTETLLVAREPFKISDGNAGRAPDALAMAQGFVLSLLRAAENQNLQKALLGQTILTAALGARRFAYQGSSGMVAYQGCAAYALANAMGEAALSRERDEAVMSYPVWVSKVPQGNRPQTDTYFVSLVKADLILVCNNRDFLTETLSRIASPRNPRALPANLPEWKSVDRTAPLWAVRHYRAERQNLDLSRSSVVGLDKDQASVGVIVEFGVAGGVLKSRMISKSDPWKQLVDREFLPAAKSRLVDIGVWELSLDAKPETVAEATLILMGILGFVVII